MEQGICRQNTSSGLQIPHKINYLKGGSWALPHIYAIGLEIANPGYKIQI